MSIHSMRQVAGRALMALSMGVGLGLVALNTSCAKNDSSYTDPAPAISSFLVCKDQTFFLGDPTKTGTTIAITSGSSVYLRGNFAMTGGSAVITPGNLPVTTNVALSTGPITTPTTYTLTVTNAAGVTVTNQVSVAIPVPADATISTSAGAATTLTIGTTGLTASVPSQAGCTYLWSISGGTAVGAASANTFSFTAGNTVGGTLQLTCVVKNAAQTATTGTLSFTLKDTAPTSLSFNPAALSLLNSVPMAASPVPTVAGPSLPGSVVFSLAPTSDPLPNGLSLSAGGLISGTPNVLGTLPHTYNIIVRATNTGGFVDGTLVITLQPAPAFSLTSPTSPGAPVGPGANVVLTWSVDASVNSFTITPTVQTLPFTPTTLSGTFNLPAPAATQVYTMTVQPGSLITTATVHVDASDITIGSFGPAVVPYGSTQATLNWTITGGFPNIQFVQDPSSFKISGNLAGAVRSFTVTPLLPRRQTYTLTAQNAAKTAIKTGFVAQRALYYVAGSHSSGRGNVDGGVDLDGFSTARFYRPNAITWDEKANDGTMIVCDYSGNLVRRITPDRVVRTIAGTPGVAGVVTNNADLTTVFNPRNSAVDPVTGDIYVGGEGFTNKRMLKLTPNGDGTYTPSAVSGFALNTNALVIDSTRMMYFVEFSATTGNLYKMDLAAGTPASLIVNLGPTVTSATAMAKDFNGGRKLLYLVGSSKIFKIDLAPATPTASLIAGNGTLGFTDNTTAASGLLRAPQGIAVDTTGNVYIADRDNFAVRMIPATGPLAGALITIAGKTGTQTEGYASSATTLDGTATLPTSATACLSNAYYVAVQGDGTTGTKIYVADGGGPLFDNQSIRQITVSSPATGQLTYTLDDPAKPGFAYAGSPRVTGNADGVGPTAKFNFGTGSGANLATLPDGSLTFAADTVNNAVRIIAANGTVTTLKDGTSTNFIFTTPKSVAVQVNPGTKALVALFVGDAAASKKVRRFTPNGDGTFTEDATFVVTGGTYPVSPDVQGMTVDNTGTGTLYVTDATLAKVFKVDLSNNTSTEFVAATGAKPMGVALQNDANGKFLWVAVFTANQVKKYDMAGTLVLTVGTGTAGYADGSAVTATLVAPTGIAVDGNGFAFVNNFSSSTTSVQNGLRAIDASTGAVTTLFGYATNVAPAVVPTLFGLKSGLLLSDTPAATAGKSFSGAVIFAPQGLTVNQDGDLLVSTPHSIYQVVAPANK